MDDTGCAGCRPASACANDGYNHSSANHDHGSPDYNQHHNNNYDNDHGFAYPASASRLMKSRKHIETLGICTLNFTYGISNFDI